MSLSLDKSTWKRVAFGDVVRNVNTTVRDLDSSGIDRVIAMEHLDPGQLKVSRWGDLGDGTTFTRRVKPGQTLFGKRRAYQRKVAYADFEAVCSGDILTFEADASQLLPKFLPFLVQSDGFFDHALGTSAGSLSPRTNWGALAGFEFDLPPLDEQKGIADLLWAVERHRASVARLVQALSADESIDGLGRALFDSASTRWPRVRFGEALKVSSGGFLPAKDMKPGMVPVFGGNGISGYHDQSNNDSPVVLIGRVGAYCGVVHHTNGPTWVTDNALIVKRSDGLDDRFLAAALRHARLNQYASQTAQPAVSGVGLAEAPLARPTLEEQVDFVRSRTEVEFARGSALNQQTALGILRTSLLNDIFGAN